MSHEVQTVSNNRYQLSYASNQQEFVTMRVGKQLFGISVMAVQDVLRKQNIAHIPLAPAVIAGSLNLRGRIVTAIDMRVRLGLPLANGYENCMNVVIEYHHDLYSLLVDSVGEVLSLPMEKFEKSPVNLSGGWQDVSAGVFKLKEELLVILDVESIVNIKG